jgi:hypothetical protein
MMTPDQIAARDELKTIRAIRYGIYQSMQRIRTVLMVPGEWDDPTILPADVVASKLITEATNNLPAAVLTHTCHEHTLRWIARQRAKVLGGSS